MCKFSMTCKLILCHISCYLISHHSMRRMRLESNMATMFKKPKRNFRRKINTSDSENENDNGPETMDVDDDVSQDSVSMEVPSDPPKPKEKKKKNKAKEKEPSTKSVLSFVHDDEGWFSFSLGRLDLYCKILNRFVIV